MKYKHIHSIKCIERCYHAFAFLAVEYMYVHG